MVGVTDKISNIQIYNTTKNQMHAGAQHIIVYYNIHTVCCATRAHIITAINIKSRIPLFISVAPTLPGRNALLHALAHILYNILYTFLYKFPTAFLQGRVRGQFLEILHTHTHIQPHMRRNILVLFLLFFFWKIITYS